MFGPPESANPFAFELNLMPSTLAEFIASNTEAIASVLDTPVRKA